MKQSLVAALGSIILSCGPGSEFEPLQSQTEQACASLGARAFTQNELKATTSPTDFAIQGAGFFNFERGTTRFFSRVAHLRLSDEGTFVTAQGHTLMTRGNRGTEPVTIGTAFIGPQATNTVTMRANLDASSPTQRFDPASSAMQSTVTIFDSSGRALDVDISWSHVGEGLWEFHAMTDGGGVAGGEAGVPTEIASGALTFDTDGRLVSSVGTSSFTPLGRTRSQPLSFDFGDPTTLGGTGLSGVTQFGAPNVTTFTAQNGSTAGVLQTFTMREDGALRGHFSNGVERTIATVSLALFDAPQALLELPDDMVVETLSSGWAQNDLALKGGRGAILQSMLEVIPTSTCGL